MKVIDKGTGLEFELYFDAAVERDLAELRHEECKHSDTHLVRFTAANQAVHVRNCCTVCGKLVGMHLKKDAGHESLPAYDQRVRVAYDDKRERERSEVIQKHLRLQRERTSEFWTRYNLYLDSDQWRALRSKVLLRCNRICEGCMERPATEVHHLSYDNVFDELLFQLIGLCKQCHDKCPRRNEPIGDEAEFEVA